MDMDISIRKGKVVKIRCRGCDRHCLLMDYDKEGQISCIYDRNCEKGIDTVTVMYLVESIENYFTEQKELKEVEERISKRLE